MSKFWHNLIAWLFRVSGAVTIGLVDWRILAGVLLLMIGNNMYIERLRPVVLDPRAAAPKDNLARMTTKGPQ